MQCQFDAILKCENHEFMYFQRGQNLGYPKFKMTKSSRHIYTLGKNTLNLLLLNSNSLFWKIVNVNKQLKMQTSIIRNSYSDRPFYTLDSFFINEKVTWTSFILNIILDSSELQNLDMTCMIKCPKELFKVEVCIKIYFSTKSFEFENCNKRKWNFLTLLKLCY